MRGPIIFRRLWFNGACILLWEERRIPTRLLLHEKVYLTLVDEFLKERRIAGYIHTFPVAGKDKDKGLPFNVSRIVNPVTGDSIPISLVDIPECYLESIPFPPHLMKVREEGLWTSR